MGHFGGSGYRMLPRHGCSSFSGVTESGYNSQLREPMVANELRTASKTNRCSRSSCNLHGCFTLPSRNLHVTAGQIFHELLGDGVSGRSLHMQKNETFASNSNIKIVQRAALIQIAAGALPGPTGYQLRLCQRAL